MINPNRTAELIKPILILTTIIFLLHLAYTIFIREDEDDDFSVTVTYNCKPVLENRNYYPGQVVDMCEELRRSL
jgi:hypothetical protein